MAYATIDELLASYPASTRPDETSNADQIAELTTQLEDVSDALTDEISIDFYRHPADAYDPDEERLFDGKGSHRLHVHEGILELAVVEIRSARNADWTVVDEDDYVLVAMYGRQGRPADHVDFLNRRWPRGPETVRLTGTFGFETVPPAIRRATIAWARQGVSGSDTFSGGIVGPDELGRPVGPNRMPDLTYRVVERERRRYMSCGT